MAGPSAKPLGSPRPCEVVERMAMFRYSAYHVPIWQSVIRNNGHRLLAADRAVGTPHLGRGGFIGSQACQIFILPFPPTDVNKRRQCGPTGTEIPPSQKPGMEHLPWQDSLSFSTCPLLSRVQDARKCRSGVPRVPYGPVACMPEAPTESRRPPR